MDNTTGGSTSRYVKLTNINSDAASLEDYSSAFDPVVEAVAGFGKAVDDAAKVIAKFAAENRGFVDAYEPYDISNVKLILPHKKHLVPMHQEAKKQEQLKMWGLRK